MPVKPPIMPGWDGFDVVRHVQRSLPVPVLVDNDVNIMALGERTAYWPEHDNFLFIKVATGIGAGIISSGQLQRGANGTAGDLGHVRVPRGDDVLCRCGNYGCLEALASGPAVAQALTLQGLHGGQRRRRAAPRGRGKPAGHPGAAPGRPGPRATCWPPW